MWCSWLKIKEDAISCVQSTSKLFPNSVVITGFAKVLREAVFHSTLFSDRNSCISIEYLFLLCYVVLFILPVTKRSFFPVGSCWRNLSSPCELLTWKTRKMVLWMSKSKWFLRVCFMQTACEFWLYFSIDLIWLARVGTSIFAYFYQSVFFVSFIAFLLWNKRI